MSGFLHAIQCCFGCDPNDNTKLNFHNHTKCPNLITYGSKLGELANLPEKLESQPLSGKVQVLNVGGVYIEVPNIAASIEFDYVTKPQRYHKFHTVEIDIDVFNKDITEIESEKGKAYPNPPMSDNKMVLEVPSVEGLAKYLKFDLSTAAEVDIFNTQNPLREESKPPRHLRDICSLAADQNTLWCLKAASVVYDDDSDLIPGLTSVAGNYKDKLGKPADGTDRNHTRWHLWEDDNQPGVFILAFRGTHIRGKQYIDALSDISVVPFMVQLSHDTDLKVGAHSGFYTGINNVRDEIYAELDKLSVKKLYVAGHSMGASLAQLFLFVHLRDHALKPFPYEAYAITIAAAQTIHTTNPVAIERLIELYRGKAVNFSFNRDVVPLGMQLLTNKKFVTETLKDAMTVARTKIGITNSLVSFVNFVSKSKLTHTANKVSDSVFDIITETFGFCENYNTYQDTVHILRDKDRSVAIAQSASQRNAWFRDSSIDWSMMDLSTSINDHTKDNYTDAITRLVTA